MPVILSEAKDLPFSNGAWYQQLRKKHHGLTPDEVGNKAMRFPVFRDNPPAYGSFTGSRQGFALHPSFSYASSLCALRILSMFSVVPPP